MRFTESAQLEFGSRVTLRHQERKSVTDEVGVCILVPYVLVFVFVPRNKKNLQFGDGGGWVRVVVLEVLGSLK